MLFTFALFPMHLTRLLVNGNKREETMKRRCDMKTGSILGFALMFMFLISINNTTFAAGGTPVGITAGVGERLAASVGEIFFEADFWVDYSGGSVMIAGKSNGTGNTLVDDVLVITVIGPDAVARTYVSDHSRNCNSSDLLNEPVDIKGKFRPGRNRVHVTLLDKCGDALSAKALWLVP
jgi:hypothetical protein